MSRIVKIDSRPISIQTNSPIRDDETTYDDGVRPVLDRVDETHVAVAFYAEEWINVQTTRLLHKVPEETNLVFDASLPTDPITVQARSSMTAASTLHQSR